ncbi:MAG: ethylbenzene dehydrogenase-related protein [Acidimicrobiia bacterium]|nr:ethylbenzene dehydrogenase-related protein [Acidimicrobiia bacterium]
MTDSDTKVEPEAEPTAEEASRIDRRKVLIGGAAGAAVVAAGAWALTNDTKRKEVVTEVVAKRVDKVPIDDPDSSNWSKASAATIALDVQNMAAPMKAKPFVPTVEVKSLHDGTSIAFRIEWVDTERNELTVPCDGFRDSCAVLLLPKTENLGARIMGTAAEPATLLHWKADWQLDVDKGFQDLEVAFPNTAFDYYPPITQPGDPIERPDVVIPDSYEAVEGKVPGTVWLPGYHVGNPISNAKKTSSVEKLLAKGFGTAMTQATQDAVGKGVWADGSWKVVLAKPLAASDDLETALTPGSTYSMAVAVWAGAENDTGGRKSPGRDLLTLRLERG